MKKHLVYLATSYLLLLVCFLTLASCQAQKSSKDTGYTFRKATPDGIGKFYMGREISHVMDAAGAAWFDRSSRPREKIRNWPSTAFNCLPMPPLQVLAQVPVTTALN